MSVFKNEVVDAIVDAPGCHSKLLTLIFITSNNRKTGVNIVVLVNRFKPQV